MPRSLLESNPVTTASPVVGKNDIVAAIGPASSHVTRVRFIQDIAAALSTMARGMPDSPPNSSEPGAFYMVARASRFIWDIGNVLSKQSSSQLLRTIPLELIEHASFEEAAACYLKDIATVLNERYGAAEATHPHRGVALKLCQIADLVLKKSTPPIDFAERVALDSDDVFQVFSEIHRERAPRLPDHIKKRLLTLDGNRYLSIPDAAEVAKVPLRTFHSWIDNDTKFDGTPLRTLFFNGINRRVVTEESALRAANRFVKWPSQEQAGAVTLGKTADGSGYIGMKEAAKQLSIARPTINLWASDHAKSPLKRPLDVVKDTASGQLHIRESELVDLSRCIPKNGLSRGPRLHPTLK